MIRPLVAVVGDANKCANPELARIAADRIGLELARQDCRILVFSSSSEFVEWELVQGYLNFDGKLPERSIEVRYPPALHGRFPGEVDGDERFVRSVQGDDWEACIYPSFAEIDGIILIGGGSTTKILGLLAIGSHTPVVALGGLGGQARGVSQSLREAVGRLPSAEDLNLMMLPGWHDGSASQVVGALLGQRGRKLEQQRDALKSADATRRARALRVVAVAGTALFGLLLLALVELMTGPVSRGKLWLLFGAPSIAGASGALMRSLWDARDPTPEAVLPAFIEVLALGVFASGVAGLLYLLPQLWVLESLNDANVLKLATFAVPIGLVAGVTSDRIFTRLLKMDAPLDMPRATARGPVRQRK